MNTKTAAEQLAELEEEDRQREAAIAAREQRRQELQATVAAEAEQRLVVAAEKVLLTNRRAIGGLASSLDTAIDSLRTNPSAKGVATANGLASKIVAILEVDDVLRRRFPEARAAALPEFTPPGRLVAGVEGLSVAMPRRLVQAQTIASDSPQLVRQLWAHATDAWLRENTALLPPEFVVALQATTPIAPPSTRERIDRERAESRRVASASAIATRGNSWRE